MTRTDPPQVADEPTMLLAWLDYHRDTLRLKTAGLDADQLATRHPPSTLTLGGLLHHLALVESQWLSEVLRGEPVMAPFDTADWASDRDWEMTSAAVTPPEVLRTRYEESVARSDAIIAATLAEGGLDTVSVGRSRHTGDPFDLRWILVHLIEEYARHNGHADLIREAVDGTVGE